MQNKLIVFDCDSTLSSIEGIDELARFKGQNVFLQVQDLTNKAMNGEVAVEQVFEKRLELIKPSFMDCETIGQSYIKHIEPTAYDTIAQLKEMGWYPVILSGGFEPIIRPLANHLKIKDIQAVPLFFYNDGSYKDYGNLYPTTRNGGKPEVIKELKIQYQAEKTIMVGDGVSDLETRDHVTCFIGYGGFVMREKVKNESDYYVNKLSEINTIIEKLT